METGILLDLNDAHMLASYDHLDGSTSYKQFQKQNNRLNESHVQYFIPPGL